MKDEPIEDVFIEDVFIEDVSEAEEDRETAENAETAAE